MKEGFPQTQNTIEQNKILDTIDSLNCYNPAKIDLLLASEGLKPATDVVLGTWQKPLNDTYNLVEEKKKFEDVCNLLKLYKSDFYQHEDQPELMSVYVSANQEKLTEIVSEHVKNNYAHNKAEDSKDIGALLGFPETAVRAFSLGEDQLLPLGEHDYVGIPEDIVKKEYMAFCSFRLSKAHWEEELETVKKWAECIKRVHPELYKKYVTEHFQV
jgi:hypothetical protein